jgi:predicted Zn-ribbon and HTH transcriptional regulator
MLVCKNCGNNKVMGRSMTQVRVEGNVSHIGRVAKRIIETYKNNLRENYAPTITNVRLSFVDNNMLVGEPTEFICPRCGAEGKMDKFSQVETCPNCKSITEEMYFCARFRIISCTHCADGWSCKNDCTHNLSCELYRKYISKV